MSEDWNRKTDRQQENADGDYAFLQETIKDDQTNGRKCIQRGLRVVCYGFLFGAALILGAAVFRPVSDMIRNSSSGELSLASEDSAVGGSDAEKEDASGEETTATKENEPEELVLNADNYMLLYRRVKDVKTEAEKSLVHVCGYTKADGEESVFEAFGCILAENTRYTLLMTVGDKIKRAKYITAEFFGGEVCEASVRGRYDVLNIAVLEIPNSQMSKTTRGIVQSANLGTSAGVEAGDPVLALGNIYGFTDSVGYGMIQSVSDAIWLEDGRYSRFMTDVQGAEDGNGILLNLQGDVIGVALPAAADEDKKGMVAGIGITDLKPILEFLLNGRTVPYIGIVGTDVTEEAAEEQEMPEGVYVQSAAADSPAMNAGVKSGDILTGINDADIATLDDFHRALMLCEPESGITARGMRLGKDGYVEISFKIELR